ncbi:MAG: hypothetical protein R3E73_03660 [Porticoccaceae bacterium]|nr:hypothetical protein [Pseudomonadales bacterium]MCP5172704.1 hypothetical protein [Pseudomonadales bacterium]MCP5302178.1 hypothetical protein [Pseudomonadales bacterium]
MNVHSDTLSALNSRYCWSTPTDFVCTCIDNEYLLFNRSSSDTLLLDAVSFSILTSLAGSTFQHTPESSPEPLDLNDLNLEDLTDHIEHLKDLGLLQTKAIQSPI